MQHILLLPPAPELDPSRVHHTLQTITGGEVRSNSTIPLSYNMPIRHPLTFLPRQPSFNSPRLLQEAVALIHPVTRRNTIVIAWELPIHVKQSEVQTVLLVPFERLFSLFTFDALRPSITVWVDAALDGKKAIQDVRSIVKQNAPQGRRVFVRVMQERTLKKRFGSSKMWSFS